MGKSRPRIHRAFVLLACICLILWLALFVGLGTRSYRHSRYVRSLPEVQSLLALPEPPGWIEKTERLDAKDSPTCFYSSIFGIREYDVNGSVDAVVEFFSTSLQKEGWELFGPYSSDSEVSMDFFKVDPACLEVSVSSRREGSVHIQLVWNNSSGCLK
jgi:hypothetical protein